MGNYYIFIHTVLSILGGFIMLFSNKILWLIIIAIVIIMDSAAIVFLNDCPLTMLEKKYLGYSCVSNRRDILSSKSILYECTHDYDMQLELLINMWLFVVLKIFIIIILNMTSIKIQHN